MAGCVYTLGGKPWFFHDDNAHVHCLFANSSVTKMYKIFQVGQFRAQHSRWMSTLSCSTVAEMGDRLATTDMGRKLGGCAPYRRAGSPSNTMWPGQGLPL